MPSCGGAEPLTRSPVKIQASVRHNACSSRTWLVHCGDQIGPVDIRGARPLHSGCCEAVLECASHAVDSRIFGSTQPPLKNKNKQASSSLLYPSCFFYLVSFFVSVRRVSSKTDAPTGALPPELRWQSGRLLTDRSLVRSQVVASLTFYFLTFLFFSPQRSDPLRNFEFPRLKYCQRVVRKPCSAEVSSDRTNLSPFTKDYRGLALQCD